MHKGPSDAARAASVAKRHAGQAARVAALHEALATATREVDAGKLDGATLNIADIYRSLGLNKATFYRYRSQDKNIKALCEKLTPNKTPYQEPEADPIESSSGDSAAIVLNLMQQVAAAKVFIDMLELERRGHLKDIKSMRAGMKALESKNATIAGFADRLRRKLTQHGIEIDVSDLPVPVTQKPDLRVVQGDRADDNSNQDC